MAYWRAVLSESDQLRRRVAYALSQILVASANDVGQTTIANYMDMLEQHAFDDFRDAARGGFTIPGDGRVPDVPSTTAKPTRGEVGYPTRTTPVR